MSRPASRQGQGRKIEGLEVQDQFVQQVLLADQLALQRIPVARQSRDRLALHRQHFVEKDILNHEEMKRRGEERRVVVYLGMEFAQSEEIVVRKESLSVG